MNNYHNYAWIIMNKIFIGSEYQFPLLFSLIQKIPHSNSLCFDVLTQDPSLLKDRLTLKKVRAGAIFCKQGDQVITRILWLVRLEYGQAISLLCTASMKQLEALSFPLLILGSFFLSLFHSLLLYRLFLRWLCWSYLLQLPYFPW